MNSASDRVPPRLVAALSARVRIATDVVARRAATCRTAVAWISLTSAARLRAARPRLRAFLPELLGLALLALALAPSAARAEEERGLPPGIVARVHGEDVTEAQLLERLAKRHERSENGRAVLDQLVEDTCVAQEAARRGVSATEAEARDYMARISERIRLETGGARSIADVLEETRSTEAEFLASAREYLVREKMAAEDLGMRVGDEVPENRMKLWVFSLKRRLGVRTTDLEEGVLAAIGDLRIDRRRFAEELRRRLPPEIVNGVRAELVLAAATRHAIRDAGIEVTDADVEAELAEIRKRFAESPRVRGTGVTFDQFLEQTFGIGEAELGRDPTFRARIGLERLLARDISAAEVRAHWERNRAAYGERALVRQVYVAAGSGDDRFGLRTFEEAWAVAVRAKAAVLERSGLAGPDRPAVPLAESVTAVAKQFEQDPERRREAGEPVAWTRLQVEGETKLAEAVFAAETGTLLGPIRSGIGYHVLVVEERRPAPAFEEIAPAVRQDLLRQAVREFQLRVRDDPEVVLE